MKIDDNTFGGSKANITLARILQKKNNPRLNTAVTKLLANLSTHLRSIKTTDPKTKKYLYNAIRGYVLKSIESSTISEHDDVVTYVRNSAMVRLRKYLLHKEGTV